MSTTLSPPPPSPSKIDDDRSRLRKVAAGTIVGTTVEWYDFYLYAAMAALVFPKVFFSAADSETATLQAFATFAIGFIARPFGGILFGNLGDRIGRKKTLAITFTLMGVSTGLIGLLPGYAEIGILAPIMLVVIRIFQGLGAGAEYAGAAVVAYEHADVKKRGAQGAWPALGLNLGLFLSSLTIVLLTSWDKNFLLSGGWRIPFILSFLLVGVGVWVRRVMPETPEFERVEKARRAGTKVSFSQLFKFQWRGLLLVIVLAIGYNAVSYIYKTFSLAYLTTYQDMSANTSAFGITLASAVALFTVPIFGWMCDRYSSKAVIALGGVLSALFAFPFLYMLASDNKYVVWAALIIGTGTLAPMMFSAQGSFLSRQFPAEVRSSGVGTGREIGTALAGGLAPLGALSLVAASATNSTVGVGIVLTCAGALVLVPALFDQGKRHSLDKN